MIKHWIRYLILLFMVSVLYIFYVGYVSWFLFMMTLCLPVISLLCLLLGMWKLHISISCDDVIFMNKASHIKLHSHTGSIIPLACVDVVMSYHNHFTKESKQTTISFASEHHPTQVELEMPFQTLGCIDVTITKVTCYDWLGLFHIHKNINLVQTTYVFPSIKQWSEPVEMQQAIQEDEGGGKRIGYEAGETFDVHAYRPGDSLHRIHWKLSAKLDELMVREFSMNTRKATAVYFELYGSMADCEQILSHVYSFSRYLYSNYGPHELAQFLNGQKCWNVQVESIADLDSCMKRILAYPCTSSAAPSFGEQFNQEDIFLIRKDGLRQERGEAHEKA